MDNNNNDDDEQEEEEDEDDDDEEEDSYVTNVYGFARRRIENPMISAEVSSLSGSNHSQDVFL